MPGTSVAAKQAREDVVAGLLYTILDYVNLNLRVPNFPDVECSCWELQDFGQSCEICRIVIAKG